jgi:hypothetical protein
MAVVDEDLRQHADGTEGQSVENRISADEQLKCSAHGAEVGAQVDDVRNQQEGNCGP